MASQYNGRRPKVDPEVSDERIQEIRKEQSEWYQRTLRRVADGDGPRRWVYRTVTKWEDTP